MSLERKVGKYYRNVALYDVTLRDGAQEAGINFGIAEKLEAVRLLDQLGVDYIEGGWPGPANPADAEFFRQARTIPLRHARLAAFGSTRHASNTVENDPNLRGLLESEAPVCTLVGKSSLFHVTDVLRVAPETNLAMIRESIAFLKQHGREVGLDAEHLFDGFKFDREYTLKALRAAAEGGADWIALCDTNGGTLPKDVARIVRAVRSDPILREIYGGNVPLGIHAHNDQELAVANSLAAMDAGVQQMQGSVNGYGERLGNTNWFTVVGIETTKRGSRGFSPEQLQLMTATSRRFDELAGVQREEKRAFVGKKADTHKAGYHGQGLVRAGGSAYKHFNSAEFGNQQTIAVSEISGRASVESKLQELKLYPDADDAFIMKIVNALKAETQKGRRYDTSDASFELLVRHLDEGYKKPFRITTTPDVYEVATLEIPQGDEQATVQLELPLFSSIFEGFSHVQQKLGTFHPALHNVSITSFAYRPGIDIHRYHLTLSDGEKEWTVIGADKSKNVAAFQAISDAFEYSLVHPTTK